MPDCSNTIRYSCSTDTIPQANRCQDRLWRNVQTTLCQTSDYEQNRTGSWQFRLAILFYRGLLGVVWGRSIRCGFLKSHYDWLSMPSSLIPKTSPYSVTAQFLSLFGNAAVNTQNLIQSAPSPFQQPVHHHSFNQSISFCKHCKRN